MKQRWLVVIVGLPALLAVLLACPAWATMLVVCGIAGIAAYELLHTAGENVPANFYWGLVTTVVMQEIWLFKEEMSGTYDLPISTVTIFRCFSIYPLPFPPPAKQRPGCFRMPY